MSARRLQEHRVTDRARWRSVAKGDLAATQVTGRGTHDGERAGIAPTGKYAEFTASDMFSLADGRMVESWHNVDDFGLLQQLGVIPAA